MDVDNIRQSQVFFNKNRNLAFTESNLCFDELFVMKQSSTY